MATRPRVRRRLGFCRVWLVLDEEGVDAANDEDCGLVAAVVAMVGAIWREGTFDVGVHGVCGEELGTAEP